MYAYQYPLKKEEVLVVLVDKRFTYPSLVKEIGEASDKYEFTFRTSPENCNSDNFKLKHLIVFDGVDEPNEITKKYKPLIDSFDSVTLALSYSNEAQYKKAKKTVDKLKSEFPTVNYLRPTKNKKEFIPTLEKLVDNSICDSVRVKYKAVCEKRNFDDKISKDIASYFLQMSEIYKKYKLYHRSPTDGFISLRCLTGGFFITSTKTNKADLDIERISYVKSYNVLSNEIVYEGPYLPSSDCVEASVIFAEMPEVQAIFHTHASELYTRNKNYADRVAVPAMRYGEASLGTKLVNYFKQHKSASMAIMEDHGEVFLFRKESNLSSIQCLQSILNHDTKALNDYGS